MESGKVIMQGVDIFDTVSRISHETKRSQAIILSALEETLGDDARYPKLRKTVLDSTNDLARSIVQELFGNINV